ncbi:hypothetical protein QYF36_009376 [Acer negundo]|nr:hypothetical protein QYF36_009376 [Acer negundo]
MAMCILVFLTLLILPTSHSSSDELYIDKSAKIPQSDLDLLEFPLNLEYFEAEFFLYGALGYGLDKAAPKLAGGGPTPLGAKKANLDPFTRDVVLAIKNTVKGFPRPLLNLSSESFAKTLDTAFGKPLNPPFDPYSSSLNYLIASYLIPYVGLTGYVGANEKLESPVSRRLVAGLLGLTDEGLIVPKSDGAEGKIAGNVLAGDQDSVAYARTPEEILRIVYGSGDEGVPGGFYLNGGDGRIAKSHLKSA